MNEQVIDDPHADPWEPEDVDLEQQPHLANHPSEIPDKSSGDIESPATGRETEPEQPPAQAPQQDLSTIVAEVQKGLQQSQQPSQPQMTEEEFNKLMKVFNPDAKIASRMLGVDPDDLTEGQVEALQEFTSKIVDYVTTVAGYANQLTRQQLQQEYSPALEMVRRQQRENFSAHIVKQYPALKDYSGVVNNVMDQLASQGYQEPDANKAINTVVGQAVATIQAVNPSFSLDSKPQPKPQSQPQSMAPLTGGSGGGAGGNANGGGVKKQPDWNVFD